MSLVVRSVVFPAVLVSAFPLHAQTVLHTLTGLSPNDSFGYSLANCGDVDNDGVADLAIGAPGVGIPGAAYVRSGATGALLHAFQPGGSSELWYGSAAAFAGDVDGDGHADVMIGAEGLITSATTAPFLEVRSGATGALLRTLHGPAGSRFASQIEPLGDWNGDGRQEFAVGAMNAGFNGANSGRAYVFDGDPSVATPIHLFDGQGPSTYFGADVAAAGDVDGDGIGDVLVGEPLFPSGASVRFGRVRIFSGASGALIRDLVGPTSGVSGGGFGWAVANAGDVDGDGWPDALVGAPYFRLPSPTPQNVGLVRLHSGLDARVLYEALGEFADDSLGYRVGPLGDIDGDGAEDFHVSGVSATPTLIVSGRTLQAVYALGGYFQAYVGHGSCPLGDVNGDGVPDYAISDTGFQQSRGRVRVFAGSASSVLSYCTSGTTTNGCTPHITPVGVPSASAATPFALSISGMEGAKPGLVFYGISGATANAWGATSSTLCVRSPLQRTVFTFPSGTPNACDGALVFDWNAYLQRVPGALGAPFGAGDRVWAQGWFRDPPSPKKTSLTDALSFELAP